MQTWSASDGRYVSIAASDEVGSVQGGRNVIARCIQHLFRHAQDSFATEYHLSLLLRPSASGPEECTWSPTSTHIRPH